MANFRVQPELVGRIMSLQKDNLCKTREKFNFFGKNGKTVISVENLEFF